ncbi:ABC transporter I family member 11, chloroplastic-like isoform X5 [Nicotiana sylvestris]|uniref:ABC transporter I family member 11, chloroplastic-like isoform X5 n=1 Tax=Nicotiana sylvestris TaxID=4096 RepID=UPI00388CB970
MGSFPLPSSSSSLLISSSSSISGRPSSTIFYPLMRFRKAQALSISCDYSCFEFWLDIWTQWQWKNYFIAGLSKPTSGSICVQRYSDDGEKIKSPEPLQPERVGIVFQFPERYFVADTVLDEVTFGWPRQKGGLQLRELLASRLQKAITSVGLTGMSLDKDPHSLSGGYKRRLALAIQLVQTPNLLILDEPLAGLGMKKLTAVIYFILFFGLVFFFPFVYFSLSGCYPLVGDSPTYVCLGHESAGLMEHE